MLTHSLTLGPQIALTILSESVSQSVRRIGACDHQTVALGALSAVNERRVLLLSPKKPIKNEAVCFACLLHSVLLWPRIVTFLSVTHSLWRLRRERAAIIVCRLVISCSHFLVLFCHHCFLRIPADMANHGLFPTLAVGGFSPKQVVYTYL